MLLFIQSNKKSLFYPHPPLYYFSPPTTSNGNYASPDAALAVSVAIVTLPSIKKIWDDTVNIVKGKYEEGIPKI